MIDKFALVLGHCLLAIAMFRLVMRDALDVDPMLDELKKQIDAARENETVAGRNKRRRGSESSTKDQCAAAEEPR